MITKANEKLLARTLYFETDKTQAEIAATLNINPKTLYLWMKDEEWRKLKRAARQAPAIIVDNLYNQLAELHNSITSRPEGNRFPTREEAEISRKLILSIDKIKRQATLSDNIQVMKSFTSYLNSINPDLAKQVILVADDFIKTKCKDDFSPYDMEYQYDDNSNDIPEPVQEPVQEETGELSTMQPQASADEDPTAEPNTRANEEHTQNENAPMRYREGVEEIYNPNLSPLYYKELRVGNITIQFGRKDIRVHR